MNAGTATSRENLTLTDAELAACQPVAGEGGHVLRALCPFHGSDHQRSLRVTRASGRFQCFACGAWGYLAEARQRWRDERPRQATYARSPARGARMPRVPHVHTPVVAPVRPTPVPAPLPARADLAAQLAAFQAALPGSRGEAYLHQRGIPLTLAQCYGVGYAAPGTWPHAAREWRGGRVVFPQTPPEGRVVNLYGRAVGTDAEVPKAIRHDHLPGEKGYFNATALHGGTEPLWVCEGAFDALALLAAGVPRVVAIFGVQGWRWAWAREMREIVLALDADPAGQQAWRTLARQGALRGKHVVALDATAYGGAKDASAAWQAGVLTVDTPWGDVPEGARAEALQDTWQERLAIMTIDGGVPEAEATRLARAWARAAPSSSGKTPDDTVS